MPAPLDRDTILKALRSVTDPDLRKDIVTLGFVKDLAVGEGKVSFTIELTTPACPVKDQMREQAAAAVRALGVNDVDVLMTAKVRSVSAPEKGHPPHPGVKNVIAVGAGKGGVGKTTVAVNLALALAKCGSKVGILDADVYGPNVPMMLGLHATQLITDGKSIVPAEKYGAQVVSMAFLTQDDQAIVWRGPMLHAAIRQFFQDVAWKDLDYLIVDMPPGTGDIQLTLSQKVPLTGAVIVTTPQDIALLDARKGLKMFEKVGVPILGVVENMAVHVCSNCGHTEHIFGAEGGKRMSAEYGVDYLGGLPLALSIREQADAGQPTVVSDPDGEIAAIYRTVARKIAVKIAEKAKDYSAKFPNITISKTT